MGKEVTVWYDKESDFMEVLFEKKEGYFVETENDSVMEKVDKDGKIIGFSILNFSSGKDKAISVSLKEIAI
jgi:uncharacterized protein YuzE